MGDQWRDEEIAYLFDTCGEAFIQVKLEGAHHNQGVFEEITHKQVTF